MKIAMIGLGKMGMNMTERLIKGGHSVVAFDLNETARQAAEKLGAIPAQDLSSLKDLLTTPRAAWVMVPAGDPTDQTIEALSEIFSSGDVIVDGGNSNYEEAAPTAERLAKKGIGFVDAGTSGGVWGLEEGYCLMVGGTKESVGVVEPAFLTLAPKDGYSHVGPVGAGHFVKMVHNGIEYGLMQAYAEGFALMGKASEFSLDLHEIASIWRYGSVVRSWLLELVERAIRPGAGFEDISPVVVDSGEGRWTVKEAIERGVPMPAISAALYQRFSSRDQDSYAGKLLSAMRNQFGGHAVTLEGGAQGMETKTPTS